MLGDCSNDGTFQEDGSAVKKGAIVRTVSAQSKTYIERNDIF